jgi:hypothetical protein
MERTLAPVIVEPARRVQYTRAYVTQRNMSKLVVRKA